LYDACGTDDKAIRRARPLVTLRRAICKRFPPGPERQAWLRWLLTYLSRKQPRGLMTQ
jgi:hypothetical protein